MLTRAILQDDFSPVLRKIANNQDEFAGKTARLNAMGNVFLGAGSAALAFGVKSIKVAGQLDEIKKAMAAVEGAQKAAFDLDFAQKYGLASKATYLEISQAAQSLVLHQMSVKDNLKDIADLAAATGKPLQEVANLWERLQTGRTGSALGQQGFPRLGISTAAVFEAAGLPYKPGQTVQGKITPEQAFAAIRSIMAKRGDTGLDEKLSRTTLSGSSSMIEDSITGLQANLGAAKLTTTIAILNKVADSINNVSDAIKNVPGAGDKFLGMAAGLIAVGTALKIASSLRDFRTSANLAKIAADSSGKGFKGLAGAKKLAEIAAKDENKAEIDKLGTLDKEKGELGSTITRWQALKNLLASMPGKIGFMGAAEGATGRIAKMGGFGLKGTGALVPGLIGGAILATPAIMAAVGAYKILGEQMAENDAKLRGDGVTDLSAQINRMADLRKKLRDHPNDPKLLREMAQTHDMFMRLGGAPQRAAMKAKAAAEAKTAGDMSKADAATRAKEAAGEAANKYELPADLQYNIKHDERELALLKDQHATQQQMNAAKATEIAHLMKAHDLLLANAKLATDDRAKYKLLDEAEEFQQKARIAKIADKRDLMDRTIATIIGGGGISDDEVLKRTGIGRRFFRSLGGPGAKTADPMKAALLQAAKRPTIINISLDGKVRQTLKQETADEVLAVLATMFGGSTTGGRLGAQH